MAIDQSTLYGRRPWEEDLYSSAVTAPDLGTSNRNAIVNRITGATTVPAFAESIQPRMERGTGATIAPAFRTTPGQAAVQPISQAAVQPQRGESSVEAGAAVPALGSAEGVLPPRGGGAKGAEDIWNRMDAEARALAANVRRNERINAQRLAEEQRAMGGAGGEGPDFSSLPALAAWSAKTRMARQDQKRAAEQEGALELARMREAGETERAGMRESRADARIRLTHELGRQPTSLEEAQAAEAKARTGLIGQQAETAKYAAEDAKRTSVAQEIVNNPDKYSPLRVAQAKEHLTKKFEESKILALIKSGQYEPAALADGGEVVGYAEGGAIGHAQTRQLQPDVAQYGQYLTAAAQSGIPPVPFAQYLNLMQSTRGAMQKTPTAFADGGDVSDLNRPLEGPGTGRSDSIPAVIDGAQPAALSRGEFVIPEHVVRKKGTEFFEKLIAQYSDETK